MSFPVSKVVRAKAALTVTTNSPAVDVWDFDDGSFIAVLDSDAGTGTSPTLNVKLQTSADGGTTWVDIPSGAFTQVTTTASQQVLALSNTGHVKVRAVFTVAGTGPSFNVGLTLAGRGC